MRHMNEFSPLEWLKLLPLRQGWRQIRNDVLLAIYKNCRSSGLANFLAKNKNLAGKNIAIVIAFEQPWALNWLLAMAKKHVSNATILVFDNSRKTSARLEIERVCQAHNAPYLALPPYRTKHVNRSHGMAMTWIYHNVIHAIEPHIFGYIDHDLIPVCNVDFAERLADQSLFGLINSGKFNTWSIWAGYCFFKYGAIKNKPINFLYDFSRDLDTGGRNWHNIYSQFDRHQLRFASKEYVPIKLEHTEEKRLVELIDERWVHIGGISYNENFKEKFRFFNGLQVALEGPSSCNQLFDDQVR